MHAASLNHKSTSRHHIMAHPGPTDGPEQWGQWFGRKHYSLEVVQHPLRARMCGFGDKDRRPLAPAAVAKMIVRREDTSIVDVDDVDCSFFLVTADLWSADGRQEMNLVLHPSSSERYPPSHVTKPRRRNPTISSPIQRAAYLSPVSPPQNGSSSQFIVRSSGDTSAGPGMPSTIPSSSASYPNAGHPYPQQPHQMSDSMQYQSPSPYTSTPDSAPGWAYPQQPHTGDRNPSYSPTVLPSIHSFGRGTSSPANPGAAAPIGENWTPEDAAVRENQDYRTWPSESYAGVDHASHGAQPPPHLHSRDGSWAQQPVPPHSTTDISTQHVRYNQESYTSQQSPNAPYDSAVYASASYTQQPVSPYYPTHNHGSSPTSITSTIPPLPRHTYTRTLVGPLCANACRLLDEHRQSGIFFLFQDLSVRTEGTFRLRLRLMNIGAPPAPEPGAVRVHNNESPVLAQTFSDPFIVYSAKRFPGVPDTTPLSISFGNQGQKLPLRNRHGSSKQNRRRGPRDGAESDGTEEDGSDGE